eukprot:6208823-Pleurochrysis_carterae.AAC.1
MHDVGAGVHGHERSGSGSGSWAARPLAQRWWGLNWVHPPDRIRDSMRERPRAAKQRGANAPRPRDGQ